MPTPPALLYCPSDGLVHYTAAPEARCAACTTLLVHMPDLRETEAVYAKRLDRDHTVCLYPTCNETAILPSGYCSKAHNRAGRKLYDANPHRYPELTPKNLRPYVTQRNKLAKLLFSIGCTRDTAMNPGPQDLLWALYLIDDRPTLLNAKGEEYAAQIDTWMNGSAEPNEYLKWREAASWAKPSMLLDELNKKLGNTADTAKPAAPKYTCSECGEEFTSPFPRDICNNCL